MHCEGKVLRRDSDEPIGHVITCQLLLLRRLRHGHVLGRISQFAANQHEAGDRNFGRKIRRGIWLRAGDDKIVCGAGLRLQR